MAARVSSSELLVRQRCRMLTRTLPSARDGNVDSIHAARVATRRLREALPLVASGGSGRKLERTIRRLTRALGPVRELDVAMLMLDDLAASADVPRAGVARLRQVVGEERRRLHADMVHSIEGTNLEKFTRKAVAAAQERDAEQAGKTRSGTPQQVAAARLRAARRAERLQAAIDNAAGIYLPDRLHEVRIAVKKLRYAMEIARELSGSRALARILTLKRAQDLLGRMHDLEVLIARTRAIQGSSQVPNLRLSADLDQLVRHLETECRQLHGHYMAARPALLSICEYVVAQAAAKAGAASARRRARAASKRDSRRRDTPAA